MTTQMHSSTVVDLSFSLTGSRPLPVDHGYFLFSAISRIVPDSHDAKQFGVHPIRGRTIGGRLMQLTESSRLTLRLGSDTIGHYLPIAGKQLSLGGSTIRVGNPEIRPLTARSRLRSRLVTIKVSTQQSNLDESKISVAVVGPDEFLAAAQKQLISVGISNPVGVALGKRRTLRIRAREVVGYELIVEGLSADESIVLQTLGIGGRRHMGCGVFLPFGRGDDEGLGNA